MSAIDKKYMIYLAGKMSGLSLNEMNEWRIKAKHELVGLAQANNYNVLVINPVDYYNYETDIQQSEEEIQEFDLRLVLQSDFIVCNLKGLNESIGSCIELHEAGYNHHIPIFALGSKTLYDNLHPWVRKNITRRENTMDELSTYLQNFYFIK